MLPELFICGCGDKPKLTELTEWPAQYKVVCKCGQSTIGFYYGSDNRNYRHKAAKRSAIERWNSGERDEPKT